MGLRLAGQATWDQKREGGDFATQGKEETECVYWTKAFFFSLKTKLWFMYCKSLAGLCWVESPGLPFQHIPWLALTGHP